jgi:hypothetical protein
MGAVNTTYTFTATDTITSTKMNNIIDETVMTADAVLGGSGGSGGLDIASGKLSISANAINNSRLATNSVTSANIVDGTIVNADINASAAIAGTKISPNFGTQNIQTIGNIGIGNTGYCVIQADSGSVSGQLYSSSTLSSVAIGSVSNSPLVAFTNNTERMRITASGNVGVGTGSPNVKFDIVDTGYPSAKIKSSYTATGLTYSSLHFGDQVANQGGDCGFVYNSATPSSSFFHWTPFGASQGVPFKITSSGLVGINLAGTPTTALQVGGTVTATAFSGPLTGNVTGNASSASTVSNSAITAAKLDGNQSGSAPIFGVRAWANINGTVGSVSVRQGGNVSGVVRDQLGRYTITFSTPMQDTNYAIIAWARDANATDNNYFVSAASNATKTTGSFQIEVNSPGGTVDSPEIGIMVIR